MAVYTNLAIDCDQDGETASYLASVYQGVEFTVEPFGRIRPSVEHIHPGRHWGHPDKESPDAGSWHTVCVSPAEIVNATLDAQQRARFLHHLYAPLREPGLQFRSAWFGWEAQDALGEADWTDLLSQMHHTARLPEMPGLILAEATVENPDLRIQLSVFCPHYLMARTLTRPAAKTRDRIAASLSCVRPSRGEDGRGVGFGPNRSR